MENGEPDDQESDKQLQERFLALYATEAGPEETEALLESLAEKPPTSGGKAVSAEVHAGPAEVVEGTTIEVTLQKPTGEDDDTESPNSSPEIPIEFLDMMEAVEEEVLEEDCLIDDEVLEDDGCIGSIDEDAMAQPVALGEEDTPPQDSMAQPVALGEEDTPPQDAMAQPVALGDTPPQDAMAQPVALGDTPPQELPAQQGLSLPPRLQLLKRIIQALVSEGRFEVCNHSFADLLRRLCEHAVQQGQREAARSKVSFTMKPQVPKAVGKRQSRFLATVAAVAKETAGKVLLVDDEEEKVPPHVIKEVSSTLLRDEYFKPGAAVALLRQYFKKAHWVGALNGSLIFEKHKVVYPLDTVTPVKESPSSDKLLSLGSLFAVAALQEQYEGFATASLLESLMAKKLDTEHLLELMEYLLGRSTNCSLLLSSKKAKQVPVPRPSALKADTLSGSFSANQKSNNGAERSVEAADAEVRSQGDNSASGSDETVVVEKKKRKKRRKRKKSTQNEPLADPPEMAQPTRLAHPEKSAELTSLAPENGQEEPRRAPGKKRLIELKEKFASDQSQLEVASTWEAICSQQSRVMRLEAERSTTNMERDSKEALLRENAEELRKMKLNEVRLLQECQEFLSDHLGGEELLQRLWRRLNPFLPQWEPKREEKKPSGAESPEASPAA